VDCSIIRVFYIDHVFILGFKVILIVSLKRCTKVLLTTFVFLYVHRWNVVDLLNLVSMFSQSVVQKALRNLVSMFEMMLLSIPKCIQTCSKNMFVASCPLLVFLQGIRMHILLNLSTITNK